MTGAHMHCDAASPVIRPGDNNYYRAPWTSCIDCQIFIEYRQMCRKLCHYSWSIAIMKLVSTSWGNRLGKLIVVELGKRQTAFCRIRRFMTVFTKVCHWTLSRATLIQSTPSYPACLTFIFIFPYPRLPVRTACFLEVSHWTLSWADESSPHPYKLLRQYGF
jgi:hypothetical protein